MLYKDSDNSLLPSEVSQDVLPQIVPIQPSPITSCPPIAEDLGQNSTQSQVGISPQEDTELDRFLTQITDVYSNPLSKFLFLINDLLERPKNRARAEKSSSDIPEPTEALNKNQTIAEGVGTLELIETIDEMYEIYEVIAGQSHIIDNENVEPRSLAVNSNQPICIEEIGLPKEPVLDTSSTKEIYVVLSTAVLDKSFDEIRKQLNQKLDELPKGLEPGKTVDIAQPAEIEIILDRSDIKQVDTDLLKQGLDKIYEIQKGLSEINSANILPSAEREAIAEIFTKKKPELNILNVADISNKWVKESNKRTEAGILQYSNETIFRPQKAYRREIFPPDKPAPKRLVMGPFPSLGSKERSDRKPLMRQKSIPDPFLEVIIRQSPKKEFHQVYKLPRLIWSVRLERKHNLPTLEMLKTFV